MLTDAILDSARTRGDALADATVAAIFADGQTPAVARLFGSLMRGDRADALPAPVTDYFATTSGVMSRTPATVSAGERLFSECGPEMLMMLACYSLPSSYAARKGVQVLYRTAYLAKRPNRRLFETTQFVVDVLTPGGLEAGGKGIRTAQKVRLMHAAIRHLILADTSSPWQLDQMGVPINQEDQVGTLMTFSWIVLDGLERLGIQLRPEEQQAYLDTWLVIGRLMGIEPELLPRTVAEARETTAIIERRQIAESREGREMIAALLGMMESNTPHPFKTMPASLIREFLPQDVATFLDVPSHSLEEELLRLADLELRPLQRFIDRESRRHALVRTFSVQLLRWMINVELDGQRVNFALPDSLQEEWQVAPGDSEESFWEKLGQKIEPRRTRRE